ncbi:MAG: ATP-grasp domain-containing protein [Candidatus Euphemobacter frigidus]|nr:ATP-grasp domain-containing protein [Candidatus Euphemobacter frigidus]MDP8275023.1 ATP-grasp domain-containing protein [Candidatus Euphemobacter frigidus]
MRDKRVLVVGTTADYIDEICRRFPGRALFLTDATERSGIDRRYLRPDQATEVLCDLSRPDRAVITLKNHLKRWRIKLRGITCFDCESLALAAYIALTFSLSFASPEAVAASRNKYFSKRLWRNAGLPCPEVQLVHSPSDAIRFLRALKHPAVLKPLTGSGSELVFLCRDDGDCLHAFHTLLLKLGTHPNHRMYEHQFHGVERIDPRRAFLIEEMVEGEEFSCDFALDNKGLKVIRIAKKISARNQTLGTVMAYILPGELPPSIDPADLSLQAEQAARVLGLSRTICMLDFIVAQDRAVMLEMTPRPGGDCLPSLERLSSGFDMLGYALDFAEEREVDPPPPGSWQRMVGLHLLATQPGIVRMIDVQNLRGDPRVLECRLTSGPGHRVIMPPEDYGSRKLGHAIFKPSSLENIEEECLELLGKVIIEMESG